MVPLLIMMYRLVILYKIGKYEESFILDLKRDLFFIKCLKLDFSDYPVSEQEEEIISLMS